MAATKKKAAAGPRRAPAPEERKRDAERSRKRILEAATEEFAAKGLAGARVADIAARAGVNQQLISYYFGGKQGLYDELIRNWYTQEEEMAAPAVPFPEMVANYLDMTLSNPVWARLLLRLSLDQDPDAVGGEADAEQHRAALEDIRRRQKAGEVTKDFDAEFILITLMATTIAPVSMQQIVETVFDTDLSSPEFRDTYLGQLARLFAAG
jgi:TetR/AcrR family transcriptional regulator